jgi:NADPH2:quinone reductase
VRTVTSEDGESRVLLTFKEPVIDADSGSKPEHETTAADAQVLVTVLTALGVREIIEFGKHCTNYACTDRGRDLTATVVTVPELAGETFIELETTVESDQLDAALTVIRSVLADLGIESDDYTTEFYTDAVAHRRHRADASSPGQTKRPNWPSTFRRRLGAPRLDTSPGPKVGLGRNAADDERSSTVRAIQVEQTGGPEVLREVELADPNPGAGELLVEVHAAGVNYIDTYQRSGLYPRQTPFTLGLEGAGAVRAVGAGVSRFDVGDRVAWSDAQGSYAELATVAAERAVAVPNGVSYEQAAGALLQGMTAHVLVTSTYPVADGEAVLVHAAAGGVGLLLTQLASARGARVIATVSTEEKAALARAAGAAEVIRYTEVADLAAEVRAHTDGQGVAVVYDGVGASTFDASLDSLRRRGMMVLFGASSGPVPPVDPQRLNSGGSLYLTRPTLFHYVATREELEYHAGAVLDSVADGTLDIRVGHRYQLADARTAHEDLQARRTSGKLVLLP